MSSTWPSASSVSFARCASSRVSYIVNATLVRKSPLCPSCVESLSRRYWKPQKSATLPGGKNESAPSEPVRKPRASKAIVVCCARSEIACSMV